MPIAQAGPILCMAQAVLKFLTLPLIAMYWDLRQAPPFPAPSIIIFKLRFMEFRNNYVLH